MFSTRQVFKNLSLLAFISIFLFLISGKANAQICPDDMIHYWKLDETGNPTSFFDSYAGTYNATCGTECPAPATGILNGGQQFDGSNDEVNVAADGSFDWASDASFSIELWMNTGTAVTSSKVIVGRQNGSAAQFWVGYDADGQAKFYLRDSSGDWFSIEGGPLINDDAWHHIVAVRNGTDGENIIYVDGAFAVSQSYTYLSGFGGSANLNFGHMNSNYHYTGILDELALYNRALDLDEIESHFNAGNGVDFCPNCPDGYALVGPLAGTLRADTNPWSRTHPFNLECNADLVVVGFAKEGHPEAPYNCTFEGGEPGEHDYCNQHQNYENFEVDLDGNDIFGEYTDYTGTVENAWFEAGPWNTTTNAGDHEMTFTHSKYPFSSVESVDYKVSLCAKCEDEDCSDCEGKVTELTLLYNGDTAAEIRVDQKGKDGGTVFEGNVDPDNTFTIVGKDKKGTLGTEISIYVNEALNTKIHTSCSQPIGPGLVSGNFEVIEAYSKEGGLICPISACQTDDDCDDGLYCNGTETCDEDGTCSHAGNPCSSGTICKEDTDSCNSPPPPDNELFTPADTDQDGITDDEDNCPEVANGPDAGTCVSTKNRKKDGKPCSKNKSCGCMEFCSTDQEDSDDDGTGDVCDDD